MKESTQYPSGTGIILRETFNDEASVRANGGVPTNVVYKNGVASFNNAIINYNKSIMPPVYTFRFIISNNVSIGLYSFLLESRNNTSGSVLSIYIDNASGLILNPSGAICYVNGIQTNNIGTNNTKEIIISNITTKLPKLKHINIGAKDGIVYPITCKFELFEIYNRVLSPSEVKNLYSNKTNVKLPRVINTNKKLILDVNAYDGIIKNTLSGQFASGIEMTTNGNFDTTTGWVLSSGWTILNGKLNINTGGTPSFVYQTIGGGYKYVQIKGKITNYVSGILRIYIGGSTSQSLTSNGEFSYYLQNTNADNLLYIQGGGLGFVGELEYISVKEIIPTITNNNAIVENDNGHNIIRFPDSAYLDLGNYHPLTGDLTVCGWVKIDKKQNIQNIFINGKYRIIKIGTDIYFYSKSGVAAIMTNIIYLDWLFIFDIRKSSGFRSIGLGSTNTSPSIKVNNIDTQIPEIGTTNIKIGESTDSIKGKLSTLQVYEGLLDISEITQIWSSTLKNII